MGMSMSCRVFASVAEHLILSKSVKNQVLSAVNRRAYLKAKK